MGGATIVEFVKDNNNVKLFAGICLFLQCIIIALTIARAILDDLDYAVAVAIINTLNAAYILFDLYLFGFSKSPSLAIMLISNSICTAANILICFYGIKMVRVISFFVLALSFILTAIVVAYLASTLVRTVTRLDMYSASLQSNIQVLSQRVSKLEDAIDDTPKMRSQKNLIDATGSVFLDDN